MLITLSSVGFGLEDVRTGWVRRSWESRVVGRADSVDMYRTELERPWGAGSWADRRSVRRNWVLPTPLWGVSLVMW